jgi:hypothetical protein
VGFTVDPMVQRKLLIVNFDGLSDALMLTATVRDIVKAAYGNYSIDVYTSGMPLWQFNQHLTRLDWRAVPYEGDGTDLESYEYAIPESKQKLICYDREIQVVHASKRGYFPASEDFSNSNAYHKIHAFAHDVGTKMGLSAPVPINELRGEIFLGNLELSWMSQVEESGNKNPFWVVCTGGSFKESAKWWDVTRYQKVVDALKDKVTFVQVGLQSEPNPRLRGVIDLVGKTDLRQLVRLLFHSSGYLGAPGFYMHLAAAVPSPRGDRKGRPRPLYRPAVVIAGGREASQWLAYEGQQLIHTNGMLPCCMLGGCGKSRCEKQHPLESNPEQLCSMPVQIDRETVIPSCLDMISADMVIDRISFYYEGGVLFYDDYVEPEPVGSGQAPDPADTKVDKDSGKGA